MSSSTASAQVVPDRGQKRSQALEDEGSLKRIPTIDELPIPTPDFKRGEVVIYSGVSFGQSSSQRRAYQVGPTRTSNNDASPGPVESLELFTNEQKPGQIFARAMILEEGTASAREVLITPMLGVSKQDQQHLDKEQSFNELVEHANVELTRFFNGAGPIDSEVKLKEFKEFVKKQDSLNFLFSNLLFRNQGLSFNLFAAYFAPGGAVSGVGVFVNTWL